MGRYDYSSDSSLRTILDGHNVDDLKRLVALLPGVKMKAPRKGELIGALERFLLGGGAVQLWTQLKALEQSAVAEAVHSEDGTFDAGAFHAKYGALPVFEIEEKNRWQKLPPWWACYSPKGARRAFGSDDLREVAGVCAQARPRG
jgi:hypothetical protein